MYRFAIDNRGTEPFTIYGKGRYLTPEIAIEEGELEKERLGLTKAKVSPLIDGFSLPDDDTI